MFVASKERRLLEARRKDKTEDLYWSELSEAIDKKELTHRDFRIRDVFENFVDDGAEIVNSWNPMHRTGEAGKGVQLLEAGVNTAAFANITGQIVFSKVLEAFADPLFLADRVTTTIPSQFSGEKIPGISRIGDMAEAINEADPYPMAGVTEEWIETPETVKRGFIVPVTKEAIFFDRTGIILQRAGEVAYWLGVNKEKRVLDAVLGGTDLYRRNGSAVIATYGDSSGSHDWDNLAASNALTDWTDLENAWLLLDAIVDPNTGEPIISMPNQLIVPSALAWDAARIYNATEIQFGDGASNTTRTIGQNPARNLSLEILTSPYVKNETSSDSTWFIGDFRRAFAYMQNWPISSDRAPMNSEMEFTNDIAARFKVSERGAPAVMEPRIVVKNTA